MLLDYQLATFGITQGPEKRAAKRLSFGNAVKKQLAVLAEIQGEANGQKGHFLKQFKIHKDGLQQVLNSGVWNITSPLDHTKDSLRKRARREV